MSVPAQEFSSPIIRGVLIQVADARLLLPNATIAEVLSFAEPEPVADAPDWLLGRIRWRGWQLPLVAFSRFAGIAEERIWVDPGVGFGKTVEHNLELLRRLGELRELGRPIVIGTSRKTFIGKVTGREVAERIGGTIASNVLALRAGAEMLRVHDVREVAEAVKVSEAVEQGSAWTSA